MSLAGSATDDLLWRNFPSQSLGQNSRGNYAYPYLGFHDRWKEASMPKTSLIRSVVSIQRRLVTDKRTDGQKEQHITG